MKLWVAASQADYLRSSQPSLKEKYASVSDFIKQHDDWLEAMMLWFDNEPRISTSWFTARVPKHFGIHAEEWLELTKSTPIVPLIASESSDTDSTWSIDDTYNVLSSMHMMSLDNIVGVLSRSESTLFWQVALGESPPMSRRHMIRAVAHATDYDTEQLRRASAYIPFIEVLEKAVSGDLPTDKKMKAGQHINPVARYSVWSKISLPFKKTFAEVLDRPRHFLHYTGTDAIVYTRAGELVQSWESTHTTSILEIECSDDYDPSTISITDVLLYDDDPIWKQTYSHRKAFMNEHYKGRVNTHGRQIGSVAILRELLQGLEPHQMVRLIGDTAYYDDDFIGGYILKQQALKMPLLITHVSEQEQSIRLKLAALDGYTSVYVGEVLCSQDVGNQIRGQAAIGPKIQDKWVCVDDIGCIIWATAVGVNMNGGNYHLDNPLLVGIDSSMGFSDTIQLTDMLSLMREEYQ